MKKRRVLPEPSPQSLNPSLDSPEFIMFSCREADEVREEKFIVYQRNLSAESYLWYWLMRAVFPVPPLPTYKMGFF